MFHGKAMMQQKRQDIVGLSFISCTYTHINIHVVILGESLRMCD